MALHYDQGPPLSVPASFFLMAPLALLAGGVVAAVAPGALAAPWSGATVALVHLGTLGFLACVMWGALYQFLPVVAGAPVRAGVAARIALAGLVAGIGMLAGGLLADAPAAVAGATVPLFVALVSFLAPIRVALGKTPQRGPTVDGLRVALVMLVLVAGLGLYLAAARAEGWPGPRALRLQVHVGTGLLGWVGTLIAAVSWQVVPMFYNAAPPPPAYARGWLAAVVAGVALPLVTLAACDAGLVAADTASWIAAVGALPAVVAVWLVHPVYTLRALASRRRRGYDASLWFWRGAAVASLGTAIAAAVAWETADPRAEVAFGWLALLGSAGFTVHGMLGKIVPFLTWFHRFSPVAAKVRVPSMRDLWPDRAVEVGFVVHALALTAGVVASLSGRGASVAGVGLGAVGGWVLFLLVRVLTRFPGDEPRPSHAVDV